MSYYNTGAPPVNVPPPQGYGEVFSMLIYQLCILRFDFAFQLLQLLPVCLISAVQSLMRAAPLFFHVRNVFPSVRTALFCPRNVLSEHGSLCFFERSCQFACVHRPDATHCYSQFRSCQGHACMTVYLSVILL